MTDKVFGVEDPKVKGKDDCQMFCYVGGQRYRMEGLLLAFEPRVFCVPFFVYADPSVTSNLGKFFFLMERPPLVMASSCQSCGLLFKLFSLFL